MSDQIPDSIPVEFYRAMLERLSESDVPFLVGGSFALHHYTGIARMSHDFDLFVREEDLDAACGQLESAGCTIERTAPHWLAKAISGEHFMDLIYNSGNGATRVDDQWLVHSEPGEVFGVPVSFVPAEELLASKAYIMERERFDGADVAHILLARGSDLDWKRLLVRFGANWRVLLAHLVLFPFIFPSEQDKVPGWVVAELERRSRRERSGELPARARLGHKLCFGTMLSRSQYRVDVEEGSFTDGRLTATSAMDADDIELWTSQAEEADPAEAEQARETPLAVES